MTTDLTKLNAELINFYKNAEIPAQLVQATSYSLTAGGKRLRPLLLLEMLEAFGLELTSAHYQVAAALEFIHTGSLIHDDLPAMDNDDYRRGQLTSHKKFDEATAILAGDALFLDPYYLLATSGLPAEITVALVRELSYASGSLGMVAGQILDMAAEGQSLRPADLERLHQLKTGRMLTFPFVAAGIIAQQNEERLALLRDIGQKLGLAFQIRDDILDVTADFAALGKTPGKDLSEAKSTYVSLLGLDGAKTALLSNLTAVQTALSNLTEIQPDKILAIVESLMIK